MKEEQFCPMSPVIHLPLRLKTALLSLCLKVKEQCPSIREKTVHFTSICEIVMLVDRYEMHQVVEWVTEWMGLLKWAAVGCDVN